MTNLFSTTQQESGPVECLGQTFSSEQARREHFSKRLAEKLRDPAFRKIEGFPQGTDEAILAMSNPPYYTACPNPFLEEFVRHYGKPYDPSMRYSREPQTIDVSVGKTDPIYKAHSYHTKVPHLAIVPSILHYTEPGDIVLDGFGGSGMTGVAAQWCGSAPAVYRHELESEWRKQGKPAPKWGARRVILNDLSPAATFIEANYNVACNPEELMAEASRLLKTIETETGWMYETRHTDGKTTGTINFMVWSEVFSCPECAGEIVFTEAALAEEENEVSKTFSCQHCGAELTKRSLDRIFETKIDPLTGEQSRITKFVPFLINYNVGRQEFVKTPDQEDVRVLMKILETNIPGSIAPRKFPIESMYHGSRLKPKGYEWAHQLYTHRALLVLGFLASHIENVASPDVRRVLYSLVYHQTVNASLRNSYRPGSTFGNRAITGVYYVSSMPAEASVIALVRGTVKRFKQLCKTPWTEFSKANVAISTGHAAKLSGIPSGSIDYVFTDPPFGSNIFYADLNIAYENWIGIHSSPSNEAIIDAFKGKGLPEYHVLMRECFAEYCRVLKPGRWMTVVFSNSKASVWNAIQVALQQAGFVVAEVTSLDKVQGSYRQVTSTTAVKQDLVISAYKPNGGLEDRFNRHGPTVDSAWDFVQTHLKQLPSVKVTSGYPQELLNIVERDPRRIYDRMASWFIRHGTMVPISTPEFLAELPVRFREMDGMVFLPDQLVEYEKARSRIPQVKQAELFVSDERSAIDWLTSFLLKRPSTRSEIHPEYIPQIGSAKRKGEIIPELDQLLEDNFLRYDGTGEVPSQIHSYLSTNHKDLRGLEKNSPALVAKAKDRWYVPDPNKAQDLEKKREKALLKEFDVYRLFTGRKIKESRLEVLRAGFRAAWASKDYATIISIANKLPEETLQEDEKLLTLYDLALTRTEDGI